MEQSVRNSVIRSEPARFHRQTAVLFGLSYPILYFISKSIFTVHGELWDQSAIIAIFLSVALPTCLLAAAKKDDAAGIRTSIMAMFIGAVLTAVMYNILEISRGVTMRYGLLDDSGGLIVHLIFFIVIVPPSFMVGKFLRLIGQKISWVLSALIFFVIVYYLAENLR